MMFFTYMSFIFIIFNTFCNKLVWFLNVFSAVKVHACTHAFSVI